MLEYLQYQRLARLAVRGDSKLVLARIQPVHWLTFWLYIYFLLDFFLRFANRIPGYGSARPTVLLVLLISTLLISQNSRLGQRRIGPVFKSLLALVIYLAVSWPFVEWPGSVIRENFQTFTKAAVFFFFTAYVVDTPRRLKVFLLVFVSLQTFRVLEPLFLHLTTGYWGGATHLGGGEFAARLAGAPADIINPNELGFVIATAVPFLHYLLPALGKKGRLLYLLLLPMLIYALILTMSRGAMLAMIVVVAFIFKDSRHKFIMLPVVVLVCVVAWTNMNSYQQDRYLSLVGMGSEGSTATADGRIEGMISEFKLGMQRPIFGFGLGTTSEAKANIYGRRQASHNLYAELLIEIGAVGALIFLAFLYSVFRSLQRLRRTLRRASISENTIVSRLTQTLTVVFVMYLVYSTNYWGLSMYYWYLLAGLVHAIQQMISVEPLPKRDNYAPEILHRECRHLG